MDVPILSTCGEVATRGADGEGSRYHATPPQDARPSTIFGRPLPASGEDLRPATGRVQAPEPIRAD